MSEIRLIAGVTVDASQLKKEYKLTESGLLLTLSAEDYKSFFTSAVKLLREPMFFFVETPKGDSDEYDTYYLGCTLPVASAILKRYSGILYSDGVIRFGFGCESGTEIYMREFQLAEIICPDTDSLSKFERIVKTLGYKKSENPLTIWDILSEENAGLRECVECEDESFYDMIENLTEVGLYKSESE